MAAVSSGSTGLRENSHRPGHSTGQHGTACAGAALLACRVGRLLVGLASRGGGGGGGGVLIHTVMPVWDDESCLCGIMSHACVG